MTDTRDPIRLSDSRSTADDALRVLLRSTRNDDPSVGDLERLTGKLGPWLEGPGGSSSSGDSGLSRGDSGRGGGASGASPNSSGGAARGLAHPAGLTATGLVLSALLGLVLMGDRGAVPTVNAMASVDLVARAESSPAPSDSVASPATTASRTEPAPRPAGSLLPAISAVPRAPRAPATSTPEPAPEPEDELHLLRRAHASLLGGRAREALALADDDARTHPRGTLSQEREIIRIEALVRLGRNAEAESIASSFVKRFPHSSHIRRIATIVGWNPRASGGGGDVR